jgi:hypothetical protein
MKFIPFVLSLIAATAVLNTSTQAQNYPWCVGIWQHGWNELRLYYACAMRGYRDRYGRFL